MAFYDCVQTLQLCKILLLQQKSNVLDVSYVGKRDRCRLTWLSSYMYISTIGNYCITGSRYHYEYYKTMGVRNKCVSI